MKRRGVFARSEFLREKEAPEQVSFSEGEKERGDHGKFRAEAWSAPHYRWWTW